MADRFEPLRRVARRIPGGMALARHARRLLDPDLRAVERLRRTHAGELFQPFPSTFDERYPQLFDALAERLSAIADPAILSFGCSSGEEVRALRRRIPAARIVGIDLNPRMIAKARAADGHALSEYRSAAAPLPDEQFDAVLALAVFRHGVLEAEQQESCAEVLPFARFAAGIAMLDTALKPGGWLALWYAHFRFADTPTAAGYEPDPFRMSDRGPLDLLWGPDDRRLHGVTEVSPLFRKR